MSFQLSFTPIAIPFSLQEREAWRLGNREGCKDSYCLHYPVPSTRGFGEYLVGRYWEARDFKWIHHDFNVLGGNKQDLYKPAQEILAQLLGPERLAAARQVFRTLSPLHEDGHQLLEEPDLLIYNLQTGELRFAECKRTDTRDSVNPRQALGLFLLGALLKCPVDVFVLHEAGKPPSTEPLVFTYGDDWLDGGAAS